MVRYILGIAVVLVLVAGGRVEAGVASLDEMLTEKVLGDAGAPVTIIEYSSLGCPHCANFHRDVLPAIKSEYIETGKAKLIFRDFPLGAPAMAASMLARCGGNDRYFGFLEVLFRSQAQWAGAANPLAELEKLARMGGMGPEDVTACLRNEELYNAIQEGARQGQVTHDVDATPTFIVNGTRVPGAVTLDDFRKVLDQALAKVK